MNKYINTKYRFVMRIIGYMTISLFIICCQGCVVTPYHYIVKARKEFIHRDYYSAINNLQIAASYQDPRALYALGYMYYYGFGVTEDAVIARIYMRQAANLDFPPAIEAIQLLQQPGVIGLNTSSLAQSHVKPEKSFQNRSAGMHDSTMSKQVSYTVKQYEPQYSIVLPQPRDTHNNSGIRATHQVIVKHYTIQLFSTLLQSHAEYFIEKNSLYGYAQVITSQRNHKLWFDVIYGNYYSIKQARIAKNSLSKHLLMLRPWIRIFNVPHG